MFNLVSKWTNPLVLDVSVGGIPESMEVRRYGSCCVCDAPETAARIISGCTLAIRHCLIHIYCSGSVGICPCGVWGPRERPLASSCERKWASLARKRLAHAHSFGVLFTEYFPVGSAFAEVRGCVWLGTWYSVFSSSQLLSLL